MMRDSAPPLVERPGLEDVVEEEDVFAVEGSPKSGWQVGSRGVSHRELLPVYLQPKPTHCGCMIIVRKYHSNRCLYSYCQTHQCSVLCLRTLVISTGCVPVRVSSVNLHMKATH